MKVLHRIGAILGAAVMALSAMPASAQIADQIDRQLLETWRARTGNQLRMCMYPSSTTRDFDRAVGEAIAERLLLEPRFVDLREGYSLGSEYSGEDFYIALVNECDMALSMTILPGTFPQEFTVTRPIVALSYVLVTDDPAITGLSDIPPTETIGTSLMSYGDYILGAHIRTLPEDRQWRRLPYGTADLMLERLFDGTIAAMVLFAPGYADLLARNPGAEERLHAVPLEVELTPFLNRGAVMLAENAFLRVEIDAAIEEMLADGTIDRILSDLGMDAYPVVAGGI